MGEVKHKIEKSMVLQGNLGDDEAKNEGDEGGTSEGIIHNTGTPAMGPVMNNLEL